MKAGKVKPVVTRTFPLSEAPAAMRLFGEGHVAGKVVVTVG
jgi:NADPH:quinone reductase-like Zn-dependent oxidoreductase